MGWLRRLLRLDKKEEYQEDPEQAFIDDIRNIAMSRDIREDMSRHPLDHAIVGRRPRRKSQLWIPRNKYEDIDVVFSIKIKDEDFKFRRIYKSADYTIRNLYPKYYRCANPDCRIRFEGIHYRPLADLKRVFCPNCIKTILRNSERIQEEEKAESKIDLV